MIGLAGKLPKLFTGFLKKRCMKRNKKTFSLIKDIAMLMASVYWIYVIIFDVSKMINGLALILFIWFLDIVFNGE